MRLSTIYKGFLAINTVLMAFIVILLVESIKRGSVGLIIVNSLIIILNLQMSYERVKRIQIGYGDIDTGDGRTIETYFDFDIKTRNTVIFVKKGCVPDEDIHAIFGKFIKYQKNVEYKIVDKI